MATQVGKISMIKKEPQPGVISLTNSLREKGLQRFPGTTRTIPTYKENDGTYRTGLDEDAIYIRRISDPSLQAAEKKRVRDLRQRLEKELNVDLSPNSSYYKGRFFVLKDKDMIFDLTDAEQAVTFAWLRVHPVIAPSMESWTLGEVSADTQYFVNDDEQENKITYDRKKTLNDAIVKLNALTSEKKKKIARLMDLPYSDNTTEEVVYNGLDNLIRLSQMPSGAYKGKLPVTIFTMLVELNSELLDVKDLVEQAFKANIYRLKKGNKVYEGELLAWESKEDLVDHMIDPKNQADRLALEKKLNFNKLKEVV